MFSLRTPWTFCVHGYKSPVQFEWSISLVYYNLVKKKLWLILGLHSNFSSVSSAKDTARMYTNNHESSCTILYEYSGNIKDVIFYEGFFGVWLWIYILGLLIGLIWFYLCNLLTKSHQFTKSSKGTLNINSP